MAKRKIQNSQTGEIIEVDDSQLGNYGITSAPQPTAQQTTTNTPPAVTPTPHDVSENGMPKYITGHSLDEISTTLQNAKKAGASKNDIKSLTDDLERELKYQKDQGKDPAKKAEAQKAKQDVIDIAKNLKDVVKNKDKFEPEVYQDTINNLASNIILKKKEMENLGAALSGNELAILSGQVPATQMIGPSALQRVGQFFTGEMPVQKGKVVEDDKTLSRKMDLLIAGLEGKKITPEMMASTQGKAKPKKEGVIDRLLKGGIKDAEEAGGRANEFVGAYSDKVTNKNSGNPMQVIDKLLFPNSDPAQAALRDVLVKNAPGLIEGLMQTGKDLNPVSEESGQTKTDLMKPVNAVVNGAIDNPLDTIMGLFTGEIGGVKTPKIKTPISGSGVVDDLLSTPKKVGTKMRQNARDIDQSKSGMYAPEQEMKINATLDKHGVTGTKQQQLEQLNPVRMKIEDTIEKSLDDNPQTFTKQEFSSDFRTNLKERIGSTEFNSKAVQKELHGFIQDIYNKGEGISDTITNKDVFAEKKKVNADYGTIAKKKENGTTLTPREKVLDVFRQTVDDMIASKNPEVKEMTLEQSNLYDAGESLARSRKNPSKKVLKVPMHDIGGQDLVGRGLQNSSDFIRKLLQGQL